VSQINIFGSGGPSMRVWIDRQALTARNLTVTDIEAALTRENVELPAGRIESRDLDFQVRIARNVKWHMLQYSNREPAAKSGPDPLAE
jgi:multidrug efflux pump